MTTAVAPAPARAFLKSHFAPAFWFLSPDRRCGLQVVYAFFRAVDDAVDEGIQDAPGYLAAWRTVLRDRQPAAVSRWSQDGLAAAVLETVDRFGVPMFALEDFLEKGVAMDLEAATFETAMDTERYCYGVAGTVGLACLPIFGVPVDEAKDFAIRLGIAVQWINIVRDVGADARLGRVYLPIDHLEKFGCRAEDILAGRRTPAFDELIRHEAGVARSHYRRALELMPAARRSELRPARVMGRIYMDLLAKAERQGFPVFTKKVSLNIVEKLISTWRALRD